MDWLQEYSTELWYENVKEAYEESQKNWDQFMCSICL